MKELLIFKADSFLLSISSVLYGYQLISRPQIVEFYPVYESLNRIISPTVLGWCVLLLGITKLFGVLINRKVVRRTALYGLSFIYFFLFALWAFNPIANTVWLLAFILAGLTVVIAVREVS